jgi:hypothetical protein
MSSINDISFNGSVNVIKYNTTDSKYYIGGSFTGFTLAGNFYNAKGIVAITPGTSPTVENFNGGVESIPPSIGVVYAIGFDSSNNMYIGGDFIQLGTTAPTSSANGFGVWDGSSWTKTTTTHYLNVSYGTVRSIAFDSAGYLYIGGKFTSMGGGINYDSDMEVIAKHDGTNWTPLGVGSSINGVMLYDMAFDSNDNLYVVGEITGFSCAQVWDGTSWTVLVSQFASFNSNPYTVAIDSSDNVYIGGAFTSYNSNSLSYITKYNQTTNSWDSLGSGLNGFVNDIYIDTNNDLYVTGGFMNAGATYVEAVAKWDGTSWSSLGGGGVYPSGYTIIKNGTDVYVGGDINIADDGTVPIGKFARYDGTSWSATLRSTPTPPSPPPQPSSGGNAIISLPFIFDLSAQSIIVFGEEVSSIDASFNLTVDMNTSIFSQSLLYKDADACGNMDISYTPLAGNLRQEINDLNVGAYELVLANVYHPKGASIINYTQYSRNGGNYPPSASNISNHFMQYIASLMFGHPQAQAPIKNDNDILADLSNDNLGLQFDITLGNSVDVRHSILEQLIAADVSGDRFDLSDNDGNYHPYPFLAGDQIVFRVKMSGTLNADSPSILPSGTVSNSSLLYNLLNGVTGISVQNNTSTSGSIDERTWKITITLV